MADVIASPLPPAVGELVPERELPTYVDGHGKEREFPAAFVETVELMLELNLGASEAAERLGYRVNQVYYHLYKQRGIDYVAGLNARKTTLLKGRALSVMAQLLSSPSENVQFKAAQALLTYGSTTAAQAKGTSGNSVTMTLNL